MADDKLKSYEFRREREPVWRELESLLARAESGGIQSLSPRELFRLPNLYRATISSLSVARSITLDRNVLHYLEGLTARGYFFVYGARGSFAAGVGRFFWRQFPQAVRDAKWHVVAAALVMFLGGAVGYLLTLANADWFYTFVSLDMAAGRTPAASTETLRAALYDGGESYLESLYLFATFLFTHNASVGMFSFALGFAFGVPVFLLMFYNGLVIGAFVALYASRGLTLELLAWLGIHGTTEIFALVLFGGAGLMLGWAFAFPGRYSRLDALAKAGRTAGIIAIGAIGMLFLASFLEGFGRQLILDPATRYLVALAALIWWFAYFTIAGRERPDDRRR